MHFLNSKTSVCIQMLAGNSLNSFLDLRPEKTTTLDTSFQSVLVLVQMIMICPQNKLLIVPCLISGVIVSQVLVVKDVMNVRIMLLEKTVRCVFLTNIVDFLLVKVLKCFGLNFFPVCAPKLYFNFCWYIQKRTF